MERKLNFEGVISHLMLIAKQSNDQIGNTMPILHKSCTEYEFTGLIRHLDGIVL